jgi:molybdopterin/thiamine biosynthesis adenylyltransferase
LQTLQDVHYALLDRGFVEYTPWKHGVYKYVGHLHTSEGPVEVELTLNAFDEPPDIRIVNVPESLKPKAPHISAGGSLCYTVSGSIAMDIFNAASQVLACIDRATDVLTDILEGKLVKDLSNEFFAHWDYSNFSNEELYLDTKDTNSAYVQIYGVINPDGKIVSTVFTDDRSRTQKKFEVLKQQLTEVSLAGCVIETTAEPYPYTDGRPWPPKTLEEFIDWQYSLDEKSATKIIKRLKTIHDSGRDYASILMSSPTAKYAASIDMCKVTSKIKSFKQARKLLGSSSLRVRRLSRIDDAYMVERNQPGRNNLMGKRVLLIGAGAIGGHLADLLVRSGAGFSSGSLTIVDKDILGVGNIGRHKLGFESLHLFKSDALVKQLNLSFPTADIRYNISDVKKFALSQGFDLIINATGEQSLGDWLSMELNQKQFSPILTVWIEGPGAVVRSMLQPSESHACYRCLHAIDRTALYPAVDKQYEIKLGGHGCESLYVEFPATAALFAAALASNHVIEWLNGKGAPHLRTLVIDSNYIKSTEDRDPTKLLDCPACSITKAG